MKDGLQHERPSPAVRFGQSPACGWQAPPSTVTLDEGEVHVWWASLQLAPEAQPHALNLLSADELVRFARLRSPADQRFAAARAILRRLLGQYLRCEPEAIAFTYGDRGKPYLQQPAPSLQFNLSHSGDVAVYAVTRQGCIGVDVECIRPVATWERLARRYFAPQDYAYLQGLTEPVRQQAFLQIWTQKEAYVKATGEGIRGLAAAACPERWCCSTVAAPKAAMPRAASGEIAIPRAVLSITSEATQPPQLFLWRSL